MKKLAITACSYLCSLLICMKISVTCENLNHYYCIAAFFKHLSWLPFFAFLGSDSPAILQTGIFFTVVL